MAIGVSFQSTNTYPFDGSVGFASFAGGDDADYWFLFGMFEELDVATGQMIDLYGVAWFGGDDLDSLNSTIITAKKLIQRQPEIWQVHVGTVQTDPPRDVFAQAERAEIIVLLEAIEQAIPKARQTGKYIAFVGD